MDPRAIQQQQRFEKAEQLAQQAERRKLHEQVTSAIETVVNRIDITEQTVNLRHKNLKEEISKQKKEFQYEIKELTSALSTEKNLNTQRLTDKNKEMKSLHE